MGAELKRIGSELVDLRKKNQVAIYFSNRALTGFDSFKFGWTSKETYNDVLRPFYDSLYRASIEVDLIDPSTSDLSAYKLIVVPALYSASDEEIARLKDYARAGGHLLLSFKTGFSDENLKVRTTSQPGGFADAVGATYSQFTIPETVSVTGELGSGTNTNNVRWWMELLQPTTATVVAKYKHPAWGQYAALTRNHYGKGEVTYIGFMPNDELMDKIVADASDHAGVIHVSEGIRFPIVVRSGLSSKGRALHYFLNYSAVSRSIIYPFDDGMELLSNMPVARSTRMNLAPWGVQIVEVRTH